MKNINLLFLICLGFPHFVFAEEATNAAPVADAPPVAAAAPDVPAPSHEGQAFSFYIENDTRRMGGPGGDNAYSNGFKFAYTYAEDKVPHWAHSLTDWSDTLSSNLSKSKTNFGLSLAQQIYTPSNTQTDAPILDDRPYAAWLYAGFSANFRSEKIIHSLELDIGTVGPSALGEQVQNNFHRLIGVDTTKGWRNQIHDEPALEISYQQKLRFLEWKEHERTYMDLIPYYGLAVGNVLDAAHVGGMLRVGYNLPDDFGPSRPSALGGDAYVNPGMNYDSTKHWSFYGFIGGQANAVARNIFLDGNTFRDSPHVTKYPITLENEFGFGAQLHRWSYVWRFVTRSPEFKEKKEINSFASISITYSMPGN